MPVIGLIGAVALFVGGYFFGAGNASFEPGDPDLEKAVKTGQLATIIQVIEQSIAAPCQTINLFNNADPNNPREVNLINIQCEGLGLPDIEDAETTES